MCDTPPTSSSDTSPKVAIIILNWNNYTDTSQCIESLSNLEYSNFKTIIVDNGSTDDSGEQLKRDFDLPSRKFIFNKENFGFAGGNNTGIEFALSEDVDYVLLLNNDTVIESPILGPLVATAENCPSAGIVGPKVLTYSTNEIESTGFRQSVVFPFYKKDGTENSKWHCDYVHGCSVLIGTDVFDTIGLLDEDYFLYVEERDFYIRAKKAGYDIVMNPEATIYHKGMGSSKGDLSQVAAYWKIRNLFRCWQKHFHPLTQLTFIPYMIGFTIIYLGLYQLNPLEHKEIFKSVMKAWATVFTKCDYDHEFKPN